MRIILGFLVITAIVAGAWLFAPRPDPAVLAAAADAERVRLEALAGVRLMLADPATPEVVTPVITRNSVTGLWEVRGTAVSATGRSPFFGKLLQLCDDGLSRAECWRIASPPAPLAPVAAAPAPSAPPADAMSDSAAEAPSDVAGASIAILAPTSGAADSDAADHLINSPLVNARAGPGTENAVLGRLSDGQTLRLLERDQGWGRFEVVGGEQDGLVAWIAERLVRPTVE